MIPHSVLHAGRVCRWFPRLPLALVRHNVRSMSSEEEKADKEYHVPPIGTYRSPLKILKSEFDPILRGEIQNLEMEVPRRTDILIIGGGLVGSAVAFWTKLHSGQGADVTVVEKDYGYTQASTMLSAGGIRHQFSTPENVKMSMFTSYFLENIREYLSVVDQDPPDVQFHHQGYLFLVPPEKVELALDNHAMQRSHNARIDFLMKEQLAKKFPWLNLDGIECGTHGLEGEGWFDPWQLMCALKCKNHNMGVRYVSGEVTNFRVKKMGGNDNDRKKIQGVDIEHTNGKLYACDSAIVVNCAGPWAGKVADLLGVGNTGKHKDPKLPVEPRKRFVYVVHCPDGPTLDMPFVVDPSGVYVRREGLAGHYICGASPLSEEEEPDISNLNVDYTFFNDYVWPKLAERIPAFNSLKLRSAWAGYYDYNTVDQNLIIGGHPVFTNFIFANGMSGHGVQQGIAIGKAVSELIYDSTYQNINLDRFSFERFLTDEPIFEQSIV